MIPESAKGLLKSLNQFPGDKGAVVNIFKTAAEEKGVEENKRKFYLLMVKFLSDEQLTASDVEDFNSLSDSKDFPRTKDQMQSWLPESIKNQAGYAPLVATLGFVHLQTWVNENKSKGTLLRKNVSSESLSSEEKALPIPKNVSTNNLSSMSTNTAIQTNSQRDNLIKTFESKLSSMHDQLWLVWLIKPFASSLYEDCEFKIKAYETVIKELQGNKKITEIKKTDFIVNDKGGSTVEQALMKNTGILRLWDKKRETESIALLNKAEKDETPTQTSTLKH